MSTERIQQRLGVETSKESANTDTLLKISLDSSERLLPPDSINKIVNESEQFNKERQNSSYYRILGTLNATVSNPLFNLNDSTLLDDFTWKGFNYSDLNTGQFRFDNPVYSEAIKNYLKEQDGWFGYIKPDSKKKNLCSFFDMEPKRERFSFIQDINPFHAPKHTPVKNWGLTITYPHSIDSGHTMVNTGLLIVESKPVIVSEKQMVAFGMPCLHNLNVGDTVVITGTNGYDGEHTIVRTGLDNGELKPYYFVIDAAPTGSISSNSRMKRKINGFESKYYFRIFRKVKTRNAPIIELDDYEIYKLAFSQNIFNDKIAQFVFNEDIDISNLIDNLGRPLSELYLTIVKTDSNNLFSSVSSGIETPYLSDLTNSDTITYLQAVPVINRIHNGGTLPFTSHTPLETNVVITNLDYYGDVVEYNISEVKETVLADVSHRFNTRNRETSPSMTYITNNNTIPALTNTISLGPRQEGYFYKAHQLIKIRDFSLYIEQGDINTVGIPDYAVNLNDGRYLWRDLIDIDTIQADGSVLDYPFLNGCHYMYNNYCFTVRRQDPFDNWGLYYGNFPADPIGKRITDKFDVNSEENVC